MVALTMVFAWSAVSAQEVEHAIPGDPVQIETGRMAGKLLASGVRAYLGVPYAAAPVGELRWQEPQRRASWGGIYHADRFAPECIQILRPHDINHYFGEEATSEDCLYLNIWAPPLDMQARSAPVILWFHGGGFSIGSAAMPNYGGENLAKKGVVYVTAAYRLGAFGFMAHPQLTGQSSRHASGNYGFLDQVAVLQWIQRNIVRFGGDPSRVTVMGQSAGASSAFYLQASPLARGLFHGIVGMSGGGLRVGSDPASLHEAEQSGLELQRALKVNSLAALRNVPADRILAVQAEFQLGGTAGTVRFRPNVDGHFLPRTPRQTFAAGEQNDVPLLLGFTRDESSNELRTASSMAQFTEIAQRYFEGRAPRFLQLYPARNDAEVAILGAAANRDAGMATSMRSWALGQLEKGRSAVYMYMYAHPHSFAPGVAIADLDPVAAGAYHTSEVPFFLMTLDAYNLRRKTREWGEYDRQLAQTMSDVIVAFASTGRPDTAQVVMPRFERRRQQLIEFGDELRVIAFDRARMDFFATENLPGVVGSAAPRSPRD